MKYIKLFEQFSINEEAKHEDLKVGMKVYSRDRPNEIGTIELIQLSNVKGMEKAGSIHIKDDKTGREWKASGGELTIVNEGYYDDIEGHVSKSEAGKGNVDHTGKSSHFQHNDLVKNDIGQTGKVYDVLITPDKKGTVVVVKWEKDGMKQIGKYGPGFSPIEDIEKV